MRPLRDSTTSNGRFPPTAASAFGWKRSTCGSSQPVAWQYCFDRVEQTAWSAAVDRVSRSAARRDGRRDRAGRAGPGAQDDPVAEAAPGRRRTPSRTCSRPPYSSDHWRAGRPRPRRSIGSIGVMPMPPAMNDVALGRAQLEVVARAADADVGSRWRAGVWTYADPPRPSGSRSTAMRHVADVGRVAAQRDTAAPNRCRAPDPRARPAARRQAADRPRAAASAR